MSSKDIFHRELQRRANDEIKIYNPTDADYPIRYNGYVWTVKAMQDLIVPRYIAMHYLKHMTDALILKESAELVEREKKKYRGNFWHGEEERIALRTNNPELRKKYIKVLWKGIVRKFGMDEISAEAEAKEDSSIPQDEQILEELETQAELVQEPQNPIEALTEEIAEKP